MIQIDNTIISRDLIEKNFICNISKCKGVCCVEGDSGAPVKETEKVVLEEIFPKVKKYLSLQAVEAIKKQGTSMIDFEGELTTPLINNKECVYVMKNGQDIIECAIEKAYNNNEIDFEKPISCHLYPIRINRYEKYDALNYDEWSICVDACLLGEKLNKPIYKFCREALIREYGEVWYNDLLEAINLIEKDKLSS